MYLKYYDVVSYRFYSSGGTAGAAYEDYKNAWQEDKIKAYALCPTYTDTALVGEERE